MSVLAIFLLSVLASADDLTTGKMAYSNRDFDRAVQEFRRAARFNPKSSNAQLWLGRALGRKAEKLGPLKGAFFAGEIHRCFERAVELNPRSIDAREDLLEFYLQASRILGGGLEKARDQAKAIGMLSTADGHAAWARIAEIHKDYQRAEEELRAAIASDGDNAGRHRVLIVL
jgi:tetratricopeptide (TPR) repeat protein